MNETYIPTSDLNKKKWYVIDCKGQQLGRISSSIVGLLCGKIKSSYHPAFDTGDYVILINAEELSLDRKKQILEKFLG
jgi:large subunit ribosomal protein L13